VSDGLAERLKLPQTIFDYPYEVSVAVKGCPYDPLLVLGETCPGNVTSRFSPNGDFEWIPISAVTGELINCDRLFTFWDDYEQKLIRLLRPREKNILSIWHKEDKEILLLRIRSVHSLEKFANAGSRDSDKWGYCKNCKLVDQKFSHKNHDFKNLRVDTQSFPLMIKFLEPSSQGQKKKFPLWLQELAPEVTFFDRYLQHLNLYEGAVGVLATLKLSGESSHIHTSYGFQYGAKPAAIGYKYFTEGFKVSINPSKLKDKIRKFTTIFKNDYIFRNLYVKFLIYKLAYILLKEKISPFDAELISKLLITKFSFNLTEDVEKTVREIYLSKMHPVAKEKIESFMVSEEYNSIENLVEKSLKNMNESGEFLEYLMYTFVHSLSHVFLIASCSCGGIGENEVDEQIKVGENIADFFIYERPLNGATRIIERNFMHKPGRGRTVDFLYYFENGALTCPVGEAEEFLYDVIFKLPQSQINKISEFMKKLEHREISLNEFMSYLSMVTQCCIPSNTVLLEKLRKLLRKTLIKGKELSEFNLHFEIYLLHLYLKQKLGREPFPEEFTWLIENIDKIDSTDLVLLLGQEGLDKELLDIRTSFNELMQLKSLLEDSKLFLEEVQKRYLRSCVDGCPSCIGVMCGEEIWGLSKYSVSRNLMQRIIIDTMETDAFVITSSSEELLGKMFDKMKKQGFVFILCPYQYREKLSSIVGKMIQLGVNIRDFRTIKTNNNVYQYMISIVI